MKRNNENIQRIFLLTNKKNRAPDDVPNVEQIRTILKNIRETRQVKARIGLEYLDDKWLGVKQGQKENRLYLLIFFLFSLDESFIIDGNQSDQTLLF